MPDQVDNMSIIGRWPGSSTTENAGLLFGSFPENLHVWATLSSVLFCGVVGHSTIAGDLL